MTGAGGGAPGCEATKGAWPSMADAAHLQGVRLRKEGSSAHLHGEPDVDHLRSDVAQGQVADHHLLGRVRLSQPHVLSRGVGCPRQLREEGRPQQVRQGQGDRDGLCTNTSEDSDQDGAENDTYWNLTQTSSSGFKCVHSS